MNFVELHGKLMEQGFSDLLYLFGVIVALIH